MHICVRTAAPWSPARVSQGGTRSLETPRGPVAMQPSGAEPSCCFQSPVLPKLTQGWDASPRRWPLAGQPQPRRSPQLGGGVGQAAAPTCSPLPTARRPAFRNGWQISGLFPKEILRVGWREQDWAICCLHCPRIAGGGEGERSQLSRVGMEEGGSRVNPLWVCMGGDMAAWAPCRGAPLGLWGVDWERGCGADLDHPIVALGCPWVGISRSSRCCMGAPAWGRGSRGTPPLLPEPPYPMLLYLP